MEKCVRSTLELIRLTITEEMTKKYHLPYDSVEQEFSQSTTWEVIQDIANGFYLKSPTELFGIYEREIWMNQYLEKNLPLKGKHSVPNDLTGKFVKKMAILQNMSIEECWNWIDQIDKASIGLEQLSIELEALFHKKVLTKKRKGHYKEIS